MSSYETYLNSAREFATVALSSKEPAVIIQNAHKASEFALMAYAIKTRKPVPKDHWSTVDLAFDIDKEFGKKFNMLLKYYLGAYKLESEDKAKDAIKLMWYVIRKIENAIGESILHK